VWTYSALDQAAARVASWMAAAHIEQGEHVAVFMANRPEFLFAWTGAARIGRPVVAVNAALKGAGLTYVLDHSDAVAVIVEDALLGDLEQVLPTLPKIRHVVVVGEGIEHPHHRWEELRACPADVPAAEVAPDDPMMIMYTSGTGLPKGGCSSPSVRCVGTGPILQAAGITSDDVGFTCLPFFHGGAALVMFWGCHGLRVPLAIGRRSSASRHWDEIRHYQATFFNARGSISPILMRQAPDPSDAASPCRAVISAGCPKDVWRPFEERFGAQLFEWYASVEGGTTLAGPDAPIGSIGKPVPGLIAKIVRNDGGEADPNEVGELIFRPERIPASVAYYKNANASAAKTHDGWLHTGDQFYQDPEGFLWYGDRGCPLHPAQWREHLVGRGRDGGERSSRRDRERSLRPSLTARRGRCGSRHRGPAGSTGGGRCHHRVLRGAPGAVSGASLAQVRRRAAQDGDREEPEPGAAQ